LHPLQHFRDERKADFAAKAGDRFFQLRHRDRELFRLACGGIIKIHAQFPRLGDSRSVALLSQHLQRFNVRQPAAAQESVQGKVALAFVIQREDAVQDDLKGFIHRLETELGKILAAAHDAGKDLRGDFAGFKQGLVQVLSGARERIAERVQTLARHFGNGSEA
jgi:hypothetical protein